MKPVPRAENLYPMPSAGLVGKHEAGAKSGKTKPVLSGGTMQNVTDWLRQVPPL